MGQYFLPIILKKNWKSVQEPIAASVDNFDYDCGANIMEHSYVGNGFMNAVMRAIILYDTDKKGVPFVWCGDYAFPIDTEIYPTMLDEDGEYIGGGINIHLAAINWLYNDTDGCSLKYLMLKDALKKTNNGVEYRYCINHSKKQYVVVPECDNSIHPLPILTNDGNGRYGGDYSIIDINNQLKHNMQFEGTWAYDNISISNDINDCLDYKKLDWKIEY